MDLLFLHYNESVLLGFNITTYLTKPTKSILSDTRKRLKQYYLYSLYQTKLKE